MKICKRCGGRTRDASFAVLSSDGEDVDFDFADVHLDGGECMWGVTPYKGRFYKWHGSEYLELNYPTWADDFEALYYACLISMVVVMTGLWVSVL